MNYSKIIFSIIAILFFSCGSGKDKIPGNVLSKDKMVRVQVALHLLEAGQQQRTLDQTLNGTDTFSFQSVFKKERITKSQYDSSMMFYTAHPQLLDQVYDEVINELNKMQGDEVKKKK